KTVRLFAAPAEPQTLCNLRWACQVDLHDAPPAAYEARLGRWLAITLRQPSRDATPCARLR
ncbi:hypothetical protein, partial [Escherichia coli]|uniref:hypothetical protein n=1 Tax=Escherichia coli TaxID=562 RepID=UPI001BC8A9DE